MGIFDIVAGILILMWVGGLALRITGGLIHILLVLAVISFLLRFIIK